LLNSGTDKLTYATYANKNWAVKLKIQVMSEILLPGIVRAKGRKRNKNVRQKAGMANEGNSKNRK